MDFAPSIDSIILRNRVALRKPGVLSYRPGYQATGGWLTSKPAIVVTVDEKRDDLAPTDRLPETIEGVPVDVRQAGGLHMMRASHPSLYAGVAAAVRPELDRPFFPLERDANGQLLTGLSARITALRKPKKPQLEYAPPRGAALEPVEARMKIICHASPDAGWPTLKQFLQGITESLTVGMYDFTSTHISETLESSLGGDKTLDLVLDHPPGKATREQTIDETVESLQAKLNRRLSFAWALERNDPNAAAWIFPSAYHIKVAVRDRSAFWLSSGNWNSTNQPDIDPVADPDGSKAIAAKSDRDWHAVVEHPGLAKLFEKYLLNDLKVAADHQVEEAEEAAATLAALGELVVEQLELAAKAPVQYFPPKEITGRIKVQPLLTPDNYVDCILPLIQSAEQKFYMQTQYIHPSDAGTAEKLSKLIEAVKERIDAGVDVRLIMSEFETIEWLELLQGAGIDLSHVRIQPHVHNKGIIVDSKVVVVSSQNWSGAGVSDNRDAGLIIYSEEAAKYWEKVFIHDWTHMSHQQALDAEPVRFGPAPRTPRGAGLAAGMNEVGARSPLDQQLAAFGATQVIVVLHDWAGQSTDGADSALAAAIPVTASKRAAKGATADVVMDLSNHFSTPVTGRDFALASTMKTAKNKKSPGLMWYDKAKSADDPTPPVRYYPNLRAMLGTADRSGVEALRADARVKQVFAPPQISLIRPVAASAATAEAQYTWGIKKLKADKLHAQGITGQGVVVGHLDTGVDGQHSALKPAIKAFAEFDDMGFQVTPTPAAHDTDEHGSHTAGTIAGRTVAGRGIGVAPRAFLASAIVIEGGNTIARILAGMDWIISQDAKILNMSLGVRGYREDFLSLTQLLRQRGVLPVFAVGNEGPGTSRSPGNYVEALSVGAMGPDDLVPDFSSSQRFQRPSDPLVPDVVAPGVNVISAKPGGGYQSMDGSSMATPHIAGLAALLMGAAPSATIDEIEQAIFNSCQLLSSESPERQNRGVPDAVKALAILGIAMPAQAKPKVKATKKRANKRRRKRRQLARR